MNRQPAPHRAAGTQPNTTRFSVPLAPHGESGALTVSRKGDELMPEPTEVTEPTQAASGETTGTDWKAEARKWEARARANHAAVDELAALKKTSAEEADAHAKALKEAQDRIAVYEHRDQVNGWKQAAAKAAGVPLDALRGDTEEEIAAHAEVLKGLLGAAPVAGGTGISGKAPEAATPSAALQAVRGLFGTNQ